MTRNGHVRLIDFGLVSNLQEEKMQVLPSQVAQYSAPEVWNKKLAGLASDWWSYGVNIVQLFQLKLPFDGETDEEIQELAQHGKPNLIDIPLKLDNAKKFIMKLLVVKPEDRISKVSSDEFFGANGEHVTSEPYKPGDINIPVATSSRKAEYFSDDTYGYEILESNAIRIPPPDFFTSDYYKSF